MASALSSLKAHYGECDTLPWTNGTGSTVNGDTIQNVQNKVGVVKEDVDDGESTVLLVEVPGPGIDLPKQALAWTAGDTIYYDSGSNDFSNDSAVGDAVGYAYEDAAGGDSTGRVVLTNEQIA